MSFPDRPANGQDARHEQKYFINAASYAALRARFAAVFLPDENAGADGTYAVRSLYFDNYAGKAVMEKLSGLSRREKFRLRLYNRDAGFIRLEKKSKNNRLTYKETAAVTPEQCAALLSGQTDWLNRSENPLFLELYAKMKIQNLRPARVVEFQREAYVCPAVGARVTFDTRIRSSINAAGFLSGVPAVSAASALIVMEVKYGGFLPDILSDILRASGGCQTEFSKYAASRIM